VASDIAPPPDAPARATALQGLVDNALPDRLFGWAWSPAAPADRLTIEARLGGASVHVTTADLARPDLAKAGIGDGCHAFEIPLEPEWIARRAELSIVARAADGAEMVLPLRLRRPAGEPAEAPQQRAVEALVAGQRRLHEDLRAIAARLPDPAAQDALPALEQSHRDLTERLDALALWLTRLDERLAAMPMPPPEAPARGGAVWTLVLAAVLGGVAAAALVVSLRLAG
jgi:hypothetical protein